MTPVTTELEQRATTRLRVCVKPDGGHWGLKRMLKQAICQISL